MNESDAPFDYGFYITIAVLMWIIYFGTTVVLRYLNEYRMMRAERDWALDQLRIEANTVIPFGKIHGAQD